VFSRFSVTDIRPAAGRVLPVLALFALFLQAASSSTTQVWQLSEFKGFGSGRFTNISLSHDGKLTVAPGLEQVFASEQPVLWAAARAEDGTLYLGGGHQGQVFRISPSGEAKEFWKAPEIEVFALALGPDGSIFAGTSPKGKVYRISPEGEAETFFDPEETYIWALKFSPSGEHLFVGTGDQGKIYRVQRATGDGEVYFDSSQRNVVALVHDAEGRLLAGTDPNGILYRIDGKGKAFALYDSELPEIRALAVTPGGDIYIAAMGGGIQQMTQAVQTQISAASSASVTITASSQEGNPQPPGIEGGGSDDGGRKQQRQVRQAGVPAQVVSYPGVERSALLRLRPDLAVEKVWSADDQNVMALVRASGGSLLFATDEQGRIYRLDKDGHVNLVAETDEQQVTGMLRTGGGYIITSSHGGKVYRLGDAPAGEGVYETGVHDAGGVARWGRLSWRGETPPGTSIGFQTRSGNSAEPDETWSAWSAPVRSRDGGVVESPPARYLQWRATMRSGAGGAPALSRVRVAYLPRNSAPSVKEVKITSGRTTPGKSSSSSSSDSSDQSGAYTITVSASGGNGTSQAGNTATQQIGGASGRRLIVAWKAEDPDGDSLLSSVYFRGIEEKEWKLLRENLESKKLAIDGQALADGEYRFRVRVSDRGVNPPETALEAERVSDPVLIDQTPPAVKLVRVEGRSRVKFSARDEASALQSAEYSIDAGRWIPVHPGDGIIDSREESFTIELDGLEQGEHVVTLRVADQADNVGLAKAIIE